MSKDPSGVAGTIAIEAPVCMEEYNKHMHGNDIADQMRQSYSIHTRESKMVEGDFHLGFRLCCDKCIPTLQADMSNQKESETLHTEKVYD